MKKLLILAYDFPPYNSIGAQRPFSWFNYLKEFGWEPIVVTRHWNDSIKNGIDYIKPSSKQKVEIEETEYGTIIRAPFKPNLRDKLLIRFGFDRFALLRRMLSLFYKMMEFHLSIFDNRTSIFKAANEYLKNHKVDAIIATGEPFILFKYASQLSKKYFIPWVADYRDGWSTNYNRSKFDRIFYQNIEKRLLKTTSCITTVSKAFSQQLKALSEKSVFVVYNGFFAEKFDKLIPTSPKEKFVISFAGTLYPYQPIELFAEGLRILFKQGTYKIKVQLIGVDFYPEQAQRIKQCLAGLPVLIESTNRLPHNEALLKLSDSHLFLLPASANHAQIYAKVFDYLALTKPILLFKNDHGELAEIIEEVNAGFVADSAEEIANIVYNLYNEWQQSGNVKCHSKNIEQYSRKEQTKKLTILLNELQ